VPQGSILGPIIFAFLLHTLKPVHSNTHFIKFADDLSAVMLCHDLSDDYLQDEFNNILNWSISNGMTINTAKTKVMNFSSTKKCLVNSLNNPLTNETVESVTSVKLLGIQLNHNLKWNEHIEITSKKAFKRLFIVLQLKRSSCSQQLLWKIYQSLIRSVLTYAFPCMCNMNDKNLKSLIMIERRAEKIIGSKNTIDIATFCKQICEGLAVQIASNKSHPLRALFETKNRSRTSTSTLRRPFARTERLKKSIISFI
jgi:hypothetical protein